MSILAAHNPLDHVVDHVWRSVDIGGMEITILSKHVVAELIAAVLLVAVVCSVTRRQERVPRGLANFIEAICQYFRVHVARPALGPYTDHFVPYIWSVFFFILFCNLLGLIPRSATATGNIWTTGALAACTFLMIVVNGLRLQGVAYLKHFCPGPLWLAPVMVPVEILLTLYVAWRWELAGGILLLAEVVFAWYFFNLHEPKQLFVALTLALPAALAGVLFIACWFSWRRFNKSIPE